MSIATALMVLISALGEGGGPAEPRRGLNLLGDPAEDFERRTTQASADESEAEAPSQSQEETSQEPPRAPERSPATSHSALIDFDWLEIQPRVGMAVFSKDYHVKPSPCFGLVAHAPITWLSPSSNPDGEYFGIFSKLDIAVIKRDIFPKLDKPGGAIFMFALGLDYTIYRSENWLLMVEGGLQYCHYGGITDLSNGIAPVVGAKIGITISRAVSLSFSPEYIKTDGNHILMGWISAMIEW